MLNSDPLCSLWQPEQGFISHLIKSTPKKDQCHLLHFFGVYQSICVQMTAAFPILQYSSFKELHTYVTIY